jgi:DNA-directed RNA polymerase subunit RPC12/RpoP
MKYRCKRCGKEFTWKRGLGVRCPDCHEQIRLEKIPDEEMAIPR